MYRPSSQGSVAWSVRSFVRGQGSGILDVLLASIREASHLSGPSLQGARHGPVRVPAPATYLGIEAGGDECWNTLPSELLPEA